MFFTEKLMTCRRLKIIFSCLRVRVRLAGQYKVFSPQLSVPYNMLILNSHFEEKAIGVADPGDFYPDPDMSPYEIPTCSNMKFLLK
jgi:hypothetical protein